MSEVSQYVYFDKETGKILSISNEIDPAGNYIEVPLSEVRSLMDGIEPLSNYHVQYNPKTKSLDFASKASYVYDAVTVNEFIYEVPETEIEEPDILIVQDIPNTCWKISVGKTLRKNIRDKGINLNATMMFSVTAKKDPNILYKTLFAHTGQTVHDNYYIVPFSMPFESTNEQISVYTSRQFDTYQFKRIYE